MSGVLGKTVAAPEAYAPDVLEPIARQPVRRGVTSFGWDVWHCYELSWLSKGVVENHIGVLVIPADSPSTVESKSLKLYLNSLNHHDFTETNEAVAIICDDVGRCIDAPVSLQLLPVEGLASLTEELNGVNLHPCSSLEGQGIITSEVLTSSPRKGNIVSEQLISASLRSLCPVTAQPDWATLSIRYTGPQMDREAVSRYVSGYRSHQGFHEQVVEQIFADLAEAYSPQELEVAAFYQRRGGLDITPWRSSHPTTANPRRLGRQ